VSDEQSARAIRDMQNRLDQLESLSKLYYDKNTWTPTYYGLTTAGATTYAANGQAGYYVRVGVLIFVAARVEWTAATGTGEAAVSLPFAARNQTSLNQSLVVAPNNVTYTQNYVTSVILPSESQIRFRSPITNAAATNVNVEAAGILVVTGCYVTG
jgi:hypothetical protein